jgi:hypothetical protein
MPKWCFGCNNLLNIKLLKIMKNSTSIFAKALIIFSVLLVFASCKKNKEANPEDSFDPTKYYITGEGADNYRTSYAIILKPNAMGHFTAFGGYHGTTFNYTYQDGTLKAENIDVNFTIVNNTITSTSNPQYKTYYLQKIPDTDAFAGKTFRGTVATNGLVNGKSCSVKFTDTKKFTVSIDAFGQTGTGADYTLQNNGVATANTGNEGRLHLMSIADGKLYYSQYNAADKTHYYGLLTIE